MILAVVPVFNEGATVARVVERVSRVCPVIVVDDASTDGSRARAQSAGATCVICHDRRLGKAAALRSGFAEALRRGAVSVATLDGDGQHDPADLPRLLETARATPNALVVGDRLAAVEGDRIPRLRLGAIRAADWSLGRLLPRLIRDTQCGFRVYPGTLLRAIPLREDGFVLETEALLRAARAGYPVISVPVHRVYPVGRRSRFRGLVDGSRVGWYITRELAREAGVWPRPAVVARRLPAVGDL